METFYDPSLKLYLPLYKRDGATFISDDQYGRLCTVTGATWGLQGRIFNGTSAFIQPGSWTLAPDEGTIMAWVKPDDPTVDGMILTFKQNPEAANNMFMLLYSKTLGGKWQAALFTTAYQWNASSNNALTLNTWYHLAVTVGKNGIVFYKNGVVDAVTYANGAASNTEFLDDISPDSCFVGKRRYNAADIFYKGVIGEVSLYSRAFYPGEILNNFQNTQWRYA